MHSVTTGSTRVRQSRKWSRLGHSASMQSKNHETRANVHAMWDSISRSRRISLRRTDQDLTPVAPRPPLAVNLTGGDGDALAQAYAHGYTIPAIARELGLHPSNVSRRLRRVRAKIKT